MFSSLARLGGGVFRRPTLDLGIRRLSTPDTRLSYAGSILSTADNFWPIKDYGPKLERSGGIGPAVRAGLPYQQEPLGSVYGLLISVPFTKPIQATKSLCKTAVQDVLWCALNPLCFIHPPTRRGVSCEALPRVAGRPWGGHICVCLLSDNAVEVSAARSSRWSACRVSPRDGLQSLS